MKIAPSGPPLAATSSIGFQLLCTPEATRESNRRHAEAQRRTPIGNLRALRPLRALPIALDDHTSAISELALLVFLLCASASLRFNAFLQKEASYAR
jgi:hypothetical protein